MDLNLTKFKVHLPSRCSCCCGIYEEETAEHLFYKGQIAQQIRRHYNNLFEISQNHNCLKKLLINRWISIEKNSVQKLILQILPSIIIWQVWKSRCKHRYEGIKMNIKSITYHINGQIVMTAHKQFQSINHSWIGSNFTTSSKWLGTRSVMYLFYGQDQN